MGECVGSHSQPLQYNSGLRVEHTGNAPGNWESIGGDDLCVWTGFVFDVLGKVKKEYVLQGLTLNGTAL